MRRLIGLALFATLTAGVAPASASGCRDALAPFAFLEGEWEVSSRFRLPGGEWEETPAVAVFTTDLDGCLIRERFEGTRGGKPFAARGTLSHNFVNGGFQRSWIDGEHGLVTLYEGPLQDAEAALSASMTIRDMEVLFQHRYTELGRDSFRLESRRSLDGGETWDTGWTLDYRRAGDR